MDRDVPDLTHDRLKELYAYEPDTGLFTHRVARGNATVGKPAGFPERDGYLEMSVDGRRYKAHRLAYFYMMGEWPPFEIDHIDRIKTNNMWLNLRSATSSQNKANRPARLSTKTGVKGVFPQKGRFYARIRTRHLGTFDTVEEASAAYLEAARKLYGDFAAAA